MSAELATVSFRTESGVAEGESWTVVDSTALSNTAPWRTFRWYKGQRHYSGLQLMRRFRERPERIAQRVAARRPGAHRWSASPAATRPW